MAGTKTAPAFTTAATDRIITLHLIDASGDTHTVSMHVPVATTAANIENLVLSYQDATQASIYNITDSVQRLGDADPDNAENWQRSSVKDGVNLLIKNVSNLVSGTFRLIAPIQDVMQGNQDIPLLSAGEFTNLITALLTVKTGYSLQSAQYTERRERTNNPKVKA